MKVLSTLAFVICAVGILLNTGRSEETNQVDDIENLSPESDVDVDDGFETQEVLENDDDAADESEDDERESYALQTRDNAAEKSNAILNVADEPGQFKRSPRYKKKNYSYKKKGYKKKGYKKKGYKKKGYKKKGYKKKGYKKKGYKKKGYKKYGYKKKGSRKKKWH